MPSQSFAPRVDIFTSLYMFLKIYALSVKFKDRSWLSDQGTIYLIGFRGGKFQDFRLR